jgi:hypothetical protein
MKFFRDLLLAGLAGIGTLLMAEVALRVAGAHYEASTFQAERERGYSLRPNSEGWNTQEADVYIKINSDGLRDHERPIQRPARTLRIAVLGSSDVDGREVPLEQTFEAVLAEELDRALESRGWQADVLNFGVPGYTLSQEYLTLQNHVWKYRPQVVILLFNAVNVLKSSREFVPPQNGAPVYRLLDGKLVPDEISLSTPPPDPTRKFWKDRLSDWMNHSALLTMFNEAAQKRLRLTDAPAPRTQESAWSVLSKRGSYDPNLPETREVWAITDAFLKAMKQDCEAHGAEFRIVAADLAMQVHPSIAERNAFERHYGLTSLDLVDRRMQRFSETEGIPFFALGGPLGEYAVSHNAYLHGSQVRKDNVGHWNRLGHRLVGHLIAGQLLADSAAVRSAGRDN